MAISWCSAIHTKPSTFSSKITCCSKGCISYSNTLQVKSFSVYNFILIKFRQYWYVIVCLPRVYSISKTRHFRITIKSLPAHVMNDATHTLIQCKLDAGPIGSGTESAGPYDPIYSYYSICINVLFLVMELVLLERQYFVIYA